MKYYKTESKGMSNKKDFQVKCSFCGKDNTETQQIIVVTNNKVCICDECVMNCLDILIYGEDTPEAA